MKFILYSLHFLFPIAIIITSDLENTEFVSQKDLESKKASFSYVFLPSYLFCKQIAHISARNR